MVYKVYNCNTKGDFVLETCFWQGSFKYPGSAIARLIQCTGTRAWIETKDGRDVTTELIAAADSRSRAKLAEQSLVWDMIYGKGLKGGRRGR